MATRPLIEGKVNKGGRNAFPSQISERPAPPPPSNPRRAPLTRDAIELRMRMPLLNVCLAAAAGGENDLRTAKAFLVACVETMISEATRGAM